MRALATIVVALCATSVFAQGTEVVTTEAIVAAPIQDVWRAWTTREGMESWMVGKTDFELKVGAIWHTSYDKTSSLDDDTTIHQQLLAYDPGRMIAIRTVKPPKGFPFPNAIAKTWTVTYLEPVGESRTRVVARMFGFTPDDESQKMRVFFERGNQMTLDSLVKYFFARTAH
jgi:uncharacterized protein YndB with AHSA1/START domain